MYFTLLVNTFDIFIHVIIGQPEALRIAGNIFVIVSSILVLRQPRYHLLFAASLCLYILFNAIFVVLSGIGTLGVLLIAATTLSGIGIIRLIR